MLPSIHVGRFEAREVATMARCLVRALADSSRTEDIVTAEPSRGL